MVANGLIILLLSNNVATFALTLGCLRQPRFRAKRLRQILGNGG
jgi:hypothetical protein